MVENDDFYLYDIISHNIQLVTVNGYGMTSSLNDSEIDDFLEVAKSIEFRLANDDDDITAPGAITISIVVDYTNDESQKVTLPYYSHEDILYVTNVSSVTCFSQFL